MIKKIFIILIVLIIFAFAYLGSTQKYENLKGTWQIVKFYHKEDDLSNDNYLINFEVKKIWFTKRVINRGDFNTSSDYDIHDNSKQLQIDLKNCEDDRFNGNYNLHIDTIQNNEEDYIIRLKLDSEETYIEALRSKLKYYSYDEFKSKSKQ